MKVKEKVLCVKRNDLPEAWVYPRSIVKNDADRFFETCAALNAEFKERGEVETDSSYKQIIPYVVLQSSDLSYTAVYQRKGGEKRLTDLWSLGIGGHINPVDGEDAGPSFKDLIQAGMMRELDEEFTERPSGDTPIFLGTINEDRTDVGSVHIGAVFRILTENRSAYTPGEELKDFNWMPTSRVHTLNLELWSVFALRLIQQ